MAGACRDRRGGIEGLLDLLDEHQEAVEYDLIGLGLRLRDVGSTFTWHDLAVITRNVHPESALMREIQGEDHPWGYPEQLLAAAVDELRILAWQQTKDGAKGKNPPKPIPRPGVEKPKQYGKEAIPMDEMADWLGWSKELATPEPVRPVDKIRKRDRKGRFVKN